MKRLASLPHSSALERNHVRVLITSPCSKSVLQVSLDPSNVSLVLKHLRLLWFLSGVCQEPANRLNLRLAGLIARVVRSVHDCPNSVQHEYHPRTGSLVNLAAQSDYQRLYPGPPYIRKGGGP